MKRQKHIFVWVICGLVLTAALAAGIIWAVRRDRAMHAALRELQAQNQADTVFTSDSVARVLTDYFDHPWHSPNTRMLAHYLLGRAHADMGEAPQAIEDYQTAVECADTTDKNCDLYVLSAVYGQMADVFHAQNLPEDELAAQKKYNHYSWVIGDTLEAIMGEGSLIKSYFLLSDTFNMLRTAQETEQELIEYGRPDFAALTYVGITYIYIERGDIDQAKMHIDQIRAEAGIFDKEGNLRPGCEMFYYTLGLYFDKVNQLDSAEYYYRRVLASNKQEAGYKGLLSIYSKRGIADSIAKFAPLYADANDAMHRQMNTEMVHQTNAQYQYARHQRLAREYEQQASRRLRALYVALLIILNLVIAGYFLYSRNLQRERKKEHALNIIQQKYIMAMKDYEVLLKEHEDAKLQNQQLQELKEQKEQLELLADVLKKQNKIGSYYADDIVQKMQSSAIYREKRPPLKDFVQLYQRFSEAFSHFTNFVSNTHTLTDNEWYVCILTDLGLGTNDMAFLMGQTPQRINNIKRQANHNLFGENVSSTLQANLRTAIHADSGAVVYFIHK